MSEEETTEENKIFWCPECDRSCNFYLYSDGEIICKRCQSRVGYVGKWEHDR